MSVTINASTTSGLVMTSDLSGNLQFQNNGVNLPMGGVAPAFSATSSGGQSFSNGTFTKVQINTKVFDTNNNFDSTTNYRFTPTVAGYYQVNSNWFISSVINGSAISIYKNGSETFRGFTGSAQYYVGSCLVFLNGSTDYIELWFFNGNGGSFSSSGATFQACLVRGA